MLQLCSNFELNLPRSQKVKSNGFIDYYTAYDILLVLNNNVCPNSAPLWDIGILDLALNLTFQGH